MRRLLVIQAAALAREPQAPQGPETPRPPAGIPGLDWRRADSVLPALTCSVQASFRTASWPGEHGMVANGLFERRLRKVAFWEQSAALVSGRRIWEGYRARGGRVGMLFWQQSLGEQADVILSPAPIHKHHGGMIQDCYSKPDGLYARLCRAVGRPFSLRHYWGPLASYKSGQWIAEATLALLCDAELAPDLCLIYLPTLDYDLQRYGPDSPQAAAAHAALEGQLAGLVRGATSREYDVLVFGDYRIEPTGVPKRDAGDPDRDVSRLGPPSRLGSPHGAAVMPNLALAQAGLLKTRPVRDMLYPDLHQSRAFAVVDHQVAHVFIGNPADIEPARAVLSQLAGVEQVMDRTAQAAAGLAHPNGGELVLVARSGTWFAYPWWTRPGQAPDYAAHVDIHNKPGYDPCELFWGWPPPSVSRDTSRIRGSHGRVGPGNEVVWAATFEPGSTGVSPVAPEHGQDARRGGRDARATCRNLVELAAGVRDWLEQE